MQRNSGLVPSFTPPDPTSALEVPDPVINPETNEVEVEWRRLAADGKWPATVAYLKERQEFYRKYLPGNGMDVNNMPSEELVIAWKTADNVIKEIENWIATLENYKSVKRKK